MLRVQMTKLLTVEQMADRIDDRFRLLAEGSRTAAPRQRIAEFALRAASLVSFGPAERRPS